MWYFLDSSRLSKVVRVARFHYSPVVDRGIPLERRGESLPLRGGDGDLRAEIRDRVLGSNFGVVESVPIGFGGLDWKRRLTGKNEQILIAGHKQIGFAALGKIEEWLIVFVAARRWTFSC